MMPVEVRTKFSGHHEPRHLPGYTLYCEHCGDPAVVFIEIAPRSATLTIRCFDCNTEESYEVQST